MLLYKCTSSSSSSVGDNEVPLRSYNAVQKIGGHALDNVKPQSTPTNLSNQRIEFVLTLAF